MGDGQGRVCRTEPEAGADVGTGCGDCDRDKGGFQHWCRVGCLEPDADAEPQTQSRLRPLTCVLGVSFV